MGKYDPTKQGSADEYAKKAKQTIGMPDPLEEIDEETLSEDKPQRAGRQSGRQSGEQARDRNRRQQQEMLDDVESEDRWDT